MSGAVVGLRALGLGDYCTAVPAWKALRRAFPGDRLVLAAPAWQGDLLPLCPVIDDLVPTAGLAAPIRCSGATVAVDLHGRGPESHRALLASQPGRLVAFEHLEVPESAGSPRWDPEEHERVRWCRLLSESLGVGADPADLALSMPPVPSPAPGAAVVHPGAAAAARRWPPARWGAVARTLAGRGHRVVVTAGAGERPLAVAVAEAAGAGARVGTDLAGRTSPLELAAVVAGAHLVVSGDTGISHLASGFGTASVVVMGPSSPRTWGPPREGPHEVVWAGATGDPHGAQPDAGLLAIGVADVVAALDRLARRGRAV